MNDQQQIEDTFAKIDVLIEGTGPIGDDVRQLVSDPVAAADAVQYLIYRLRDKRA